MNGKIIYDFTKFDRAMSDLRTGKIDRATKSLEVELNRFFKDSTCTKVMYTKNTDKLFFGMTTYCCLTNTDIDNILTDDQPVRVKKYFVEIDSKLLAIGLNSRELTAVLLHEVGHVVNDSTPVEEVRHAIDKYMAEYKTDLDIVKSREFNSLFKFAVCDSIRKIGSMFTRNNQEILADEFVYRCGYGNELESAFRKITSSASYINNDVDDKFIALQWALRIYKDLKINRMMAIKVLNRITKLSGSEAEKQEIKSVVKDLQNANVSSIDENAVTILAEANKNNLVARIKRGGLKSIEEDLYEYQMRIRNVDNEDDAIVLMRQINSRMSVLDDYICYADIDPRERARWSKVYERYDVIRDQLAKKSIYNHKNYGLWLDYNYADTMGIPNGDGAYLR